MTRYEENKKITWKDVQKQQKNLEILWIIVMLIVLVIGIFIELYTIHGCKRWKLFNYKVLNYDNVSLAVLQIQATITTLEIALLALVSGRITDSYIGISWIDFQFNHKSTFFKQKRIIYGTLLLLVINIGMHMAEFYNIVTAIFLVACIAIGISVSQIYRALTEDMQIQEEIKLYYLDMIENKKESLLLGFVKEWKNHIIDQQALEYKEWLDIFQRIFQKEFMRETPQARVLLQEQCAKLVCILLESYKQTAKIRGIELLNTCYEQAYIYVKKDKQQIEKFEDGYHLFENVSYELRKALEEVPIKIVEDKLNWNSLIDLIMMVNYELAYQENSKYELTELTYFANYMSYYLAQNKDQNYNRKEWGKILLHLKYYESHSYTVDANIVNEQRAKIMLAYAIGLVRFQMFDLLKDTLYMQAMRYANVMNSKYYAYMALSIHCYIFYIAEYASKECISIELQESCKRFLDDYEIKFRFSQFLDWVEFLDGKYEEDDVNCVFNKEMESYFKENLKSYEIWPRYDYGNITLILEQVVRDYIIFLLLYMENEYAIPELLERTIPENAIVSYYLEYVDKTEKRERLLSLLKYLNVPEEKRNDKALVLFRKLERFIVQKFKYVEIEKAKLKQKEYIENINEDESRNKIINKLKNHFQKEFAMIITENEKEEKDSVIQVLFSNNILTDIALERCIDGMYDDISSWIIQNLINSLENNKVIEEKNRDLMSDDEYIEHLKQYKSEILIGSEYAYEPKLYVKRKLTDEYLQNREYIFAGFSNELLLLRKKVYIYIKDISVEITPGNIKRENVFQNSQTGLYVYEIMSNMPVEFTETELEEYLHNQRKIVDIRLDIGIKIPSGIVGEVLKRDIDKA